MIPRPLLRARCVKGRVEPGLVAHDDPALLDLAGVLLELYRAAQKGGPRWALEEAIEAELALVPQVKLARGLARVLEDRSTFETPEGVDPPALRGALFAEAAAARAAGGFDRQALLAQAGARLGLPVERVEAELYADLPDQQRLVRFKDISPERLLQRYNVALVQAVLLDARDLELVVERPSPRRVRRLLGALKFHRLLFEARQPAPDRLELLIDGPMSLFGPTRQYGLQIALFLPSALLCPRFELVARLAWGAARRDARLVLTQEDGLVSHHTDRGIWLPPEVAAFPARFAALESGWSVSEAGGALFDLDGQGVAVPDLVFDPPGGGEPVYLELLGHWRRGSAERQLELLARHGPPRYLVALSDRLCLDPELPDLCCGRPVLRFKEVLRPRQVLRALEES